MPLSEQIGIVTGGVVGLAAALAALGVIFKALKMSWAWLRKFFKTVDVIASIPDRLDALDEAGKRKEDRLDKIEQNIEAHLQQTTAAAADYTERVLPMIRRMAEDIEVTKQISVETHHEVRNNGGSSLKDSAHRIESALGLSDPKRTEGNDERDTSPEATSAS